MTDLSQASSFLSQAAQSVIKQLASHDAPSEFRVSNESGVDTGTLDTLPPIDCLRGASQEDNKDLCQVLLETYTCMTACTPTLSTLMMSKQPHKGYYHKVELHMRHLI